jgi:hypothetical protein
VVAFVDPEQFCTAFTVINSAEIIIIKKDAKDAENIFDELMSLKASMRVCQAGDSETSWALFPRFATLALPRLISGEPKEPWSSNVECTNFKSGQLHFFCIIIIITIRQQQIKLVSTSD